MGSHLSNVLLCHFSRPGFSLECLASCTLLLGLLLLTVVAIPVFHHVDTRYTRIPIVTKIETIHPALVQQSAQLIHSTLSDSEDAAISFAAVCSTTVIAATTRDARAMYSESIASFGAEFGRPLMCLTFKKFTQLCQTLSIWMLRRQISGNACSTDLLNSELLDFSPSAAATSAWFPCV